MERQDLVDTVLDRGHEYPPVEVAESIVDFYREWQPSRNESGELRVFAPSLHRRREQERLRKDQHSPSTPYDACATEILHLALYADQVCIPDPAEILARAVLGSQWALANHAFILAGIQALQALKALQVLNPLVETGVVSYYPAQHLYETQVSPEIHEGAIKSFTDDEMKTAWPKAFVNEGIAYARSLESSYAALEPEEFAVLHAAASEIRRVVGKSDESLVAALPDLELPYFSRLNAEILVKVRQDAEAFDDFRGVLRKHLRHLVGLAGSQSFIRDARTLEADELTPAISRLLERARGTTSLRNFLSSDGISFAATAFGVLAANDINDAIRVGAVSVLAHLVLKLLFATEAAPPSARAVRAFYLGRAPRESLLGTMS